jgi:organic radical activating enzyme
MKDTLRILLGWKCNLHCTYCCNNIQQFRKDIIPTRFDDIKWDNYTYYCISGGEPLLYCKLLAKVCLKIPTDKVIILYTNGTLLFREMAVYLNALNTRFVNIGLHSRETFTSLIPNILLNTSDMDFKVRFQARDIYQQALTTLYPNVNFKFWKMNDCARDNEDRIVLDGD